MSGKGKVNGHQRIKGRTILCREAGPGLLGSERRDRAFGLPWWGRGKPLASLRFPKVTPWVFRFVLS